MSVQGQGREIFSPSLRSCLENNAPIYPSIAELILQKKWKFPIFQNPDWNNDKTWPFSIFHNLLNQDFKALISSFYTNLVRKFIQLNNESLLFQQANKAY